jgi:hypothetical protein
MPTLGMCSFLICPVLPLQQECAETTPKLVCLTGSQTCANRRPGNVHCRATVRAYFGTHLRRSHRSPPPKKFTSAVSVLDSATDRRSNPIKLRARPKFQRLPPSQGHRKSLEIEVPAPPQRSAPRRFRSRLSDPSGTVGNPLHNVLSQSIQMLANFSPGW